MTKAHTEKLRRRLLAERDRLLADRAVLMESQTHAATSGELSAFDPNHPADAGTEIFERERQHALHENVDGLLRQVNAAIDKIALGTYGLCDTCRRPISDSRMDALPCATLCIECQSRMEGA